MKRYLLFLLPILFLSCKDNSPEPSDLFVGTFYRQESDRSQIITTEWKISKSAPSLVDIEILTTIDYTKTGQIDTFDQTVIRSVRVEQNNWLDFNNTFDHNNETFIIKGKAMLWGTTLNADIIIYDTNGSSESVRVEFNKK